MNFTIYSKNGCPYCDKIKNILNGLQLSYVEYKLGTHFQRENFVEEFGHGATFPRVFVNGKLLGGCNESVVWLRQQGLV